MITSPSPSRPPSTQSWRADVITSDSRIPSRMSGMASGSSTDVRRLGVWLIPIAVGRVDDRGRAGLRSLRSYFSKIGSRP